MKRFDKLVEGILNDHENLGDDGFVDDVNEKMIEAMVDSIDAGGPDLINKMRKAGIDFSKKNVELLPLRGSGALSFKWKSPSGDFRVTTMDFNGSSRKRAAIVADAFAVLVKYKTSADFYHEDNPDNGLAGWIINASLEDNGDITCGFFDANGDQLLDTVNVVIHTIPSIGGQ